MTGMGHNHEKPFTMDQSLTLAKLRNAGFHQPTFATREEILAWLEQNRHRVEKSEP